MVITYFGKQFFKMQLGDAVIAVNPIGKESKLSSARFGADIGLISVNHPDYNGSDQITYGEKQPFIIRGPGEYEIKDIFIKGFPSESNIAGKKYINTVYTFSLDNINICFLGTLTTKDLPTETKEAIEEIDMLFVPVGLGLSPKDAYNLSASFEPKVIIPMDYDTATLKTFLKEGGAEDSGYLDKYTVKRKDIENKKGEIIVLKSQS